MITRQIRCNWSGTSGSVMAAVLGLIVIGSVGLVAYMTITQSFLGGASQRRRQMTLREKAQTGLELSQFDLIDRSRQGDWTTVVIADVNSLQDRINMGLIIDANSQRNSYTPRFTTIDYTRGFGQAKQVDTQTKVYYLPSDENTVGGVEYKFVFPKLYHVISEVVRLSTGERYVSESLMRLDLKNTSDFAMAYVFEQSAAQTPPSVVLGPGRFWGQVHLGTVNVANVLLGGLFWHPDDPISPTTNLNFFSHVSTGEALSGTGNPFPTDPAMNVLFAQGIDDETDLAILGMPWMDNAQLDASVDLGSNEVCLLFNDGNILQYNCSDSVDPRQGYPGSSIATYSANTLFYCDCVVRFKGLIGGVSGIAARQGLVIEGDVQYADQSVNSTQFFSAVTHGDIVIPPGVPNIEYPYFASDSDGEPSTNLIITSDRDTGDTDYYHQSSTVSAGTQNFWGTLDIDGAYYADGSLRMLGVNGGRNSPPAVGGVAEPRMFDENGQDWNVTTHNQTDSYYFYDSGAGTWSRRANPAICADQVSNPADCPFGRELVRNYAKALWVFGSLVTSAPGPLHQNGLGFQQLYVNWDPRLEQEVLFGIPKTNRPSLKVLWEKHFPQKSTTLEQLGIN